MGAHPCLQVVQLIELDIPTRTVVRHSLVAHARLLTPSAPCKRQAGNVTFHHVQVFTHTKMHGSFRSNYQQTRRRQTLDKYDLLAQFASQKCLSGTSRKESYHQEAIRMRHDRAAQTWARLTQSCLRLSSAVHP